MSRVRPLLIAVQISACLAGAALGADQQILGKTMLVKNPSVGEPRRTVIITGRETDTDLASAVSDPTISGATLRIVIMAGVGGTPSDELYDLQASGWTAIGGGYKYEGPTAPDNDPVRKVFIKVTRGGTALLKVILKGNVGTQDLEVVAPNGGEIGGAVLSITGGHDYCVTFGGPAGGSETLDDASVWKIGNATAQACIGPCPTSLQLDRVSGLTDLDLGWSGWMHDAEAVSLGRMTLGVGACDGALRPVCGSCSLSGPVPNAGGAAFNNRRCTGNTRTQCTTTADCSVAGGTCEYFLGPPQPLSSRGVASCVLNQIVGGVAGSADVEAGTLSIPLQLQALWHNPLTVATPCPRCVLGTCNGGQNHGLSCTTGAVSIFGDVSLDCPPGPLAFIGETVPISLTLSTGTQTRSLSSASPNCRASGFTSLKCLCDTCNDATASPCASNADCTIPGGPICGAGAPGSGRPTAPNACADMTCSDNTPPDNDTADEGRCNGGPSDGVCAVATDVVCVTDADCPTGLGPCTGSTLRQCFTDNGALGGDVIASGTPDPSTVTTFSPTVAGVFCHSPIPNFGIDATAGFPGIARLTASLHATYDQ